MKTIGILGGMGPQATMDFENKLHLAAQNLIPQNANQGYPKIVTYYFREAPFKSIDNGKPAEPLEPNPELLAIASKLGALCDFLVIPSNTPHFFQKEIEQTAGKKVLSIVETTFKDIRKRTVKNVGLLAVGHTIKNKLYQTKLEGQGLNWIVIEPDMAQELDKCVFSFMEGKISQEARDLAANCLEYLRKQGAEAVVLGCSEIPLILGKNYSEAQDIINPTQLLAEATIKFAIA